MNRSDIAWPIQPGWHLGVTGSRYRQTPDGMTYPTAAQVSELGVLLRLAVYHGAAVLHHGACTGWDEAAVRICDQNHPSLILEAHPPIKEDYLSSYTLTRSHIQHVPHEYRIRDEALAVVSDLIIAGPAWPEDHEKARRSGTWLTIRIGRRLGSALYSVDMYGELSDATRPIAAGANSTEAGV